MIRIGIASRHDPDDVASWSGIPFHMAQALRRHVGSVVWLGPLPQARERWRGHGRRHTSLAAARRYRDALLRRLAAQPVDLLFGPVASPEIALLPPDLPPVVYTSDSTFALNVREYPHFAALGRRARRDGDRLERLAVARADLLTYPSGWARDSAVLDYGARPDDVVVIPYGANLGDARPSSAPRNRGRGSLRALFLGVDWQRKGGDVAAEAVRRLRAEGLDIRLTVAGTTPPADVPDGTEVVGFLDKRDPGDAAVLARLFDESDVFVLPTRAECWGIVFAEAASHGLPVVATRVGGVPEVVVHGGTGLLVEADHVDGVADALRRLATDDALYAALSAGAIERSHTVLDWDVWARQLRTALATRGLVPAASLE